MTITSQDIERAIGPLRVAQRVGSPSGMGECWRVELVGGDVVACKVLLRETDRFEREVEALSRLSSPRVVAVRGHGTMTIADGSRHRYLLSEFIEGGDAHQNAQVDLPTIRELRAFAVGLLEGLRDLHAADVIHRDIKPENVVLRGGRWDAPVLIDLGLSRLPDLQSFTTYPWAGGTWPYMAPEQLAGDRATERSDIWAAAIVISSLATGRHPFRQDHETTPPPDWDDRLQQNVPPTGRIAGLDSWLARNGAYAGYRRNDAHGALNLLHQVWT